jgi:hypothetical protein
LTLDKGKHPEFKPAPSGEMERRRSLAQEFYEAVLDEEEHPIFVSDRASLWDIDGDEQEMITRIRDHYGVAINPDAFSLPFWKLLDHLQENRDPPRHIGD